MGLLLKLVLRSMEDWQEYGTELVVHESGGLEGKPTFSIPIVLVDGLRYLLLFWDDDPWDG